MIKQKITFLLFLAILFSNCNSGPEVIQGEAIAPPNDPPKNVFQDAPDVKRGNAPSTASGEERKIVVEEVLNTEKYSYLKATEDGEEFWVAIQKREIAVGDTYYFKGGLMKKNFFSKEYERVFETVYLVSNLWKKPSGTAGSGSAVDEALARMNGGKEVDLTVGNIEQATGSIKLSELIPNKEKYGGKTVKVTGKVVKVNPMIMGRNWLHLQDGSGDDLDLTITTAENIPLGAVLSLEGVIALDKDFGAGYRYDIILEEAVLR